MNNVWELIRSWRLFTYQLSADSIDQINLQAIAVVTFSRGTPSNQLQHFLMLVLL